MWWLICWLSSHLNLKGFKIIFILICVTIVYKLFTKYDYQMCIVINHVLNQEPVKCILGQHVYIVSVVGWLCNLIMCWMKSFWYRKMEILYLLPKSIPIIKSSHMNLLELEMDTVLDNPTNNMYMYSIFLFLFSHFYCMF